ncbi:protein O-mannosyl-transferase TMTC1 [Amyelois transitella]|uniref:protein O-mannosyl-transferase TMTC1 n=1 Tax=Amyelois transitella TaxID=680683 RepID=UPI00298FAEBD|nr:protein O-mannosyl-transferase TMTC1 [Amyelois transitella]
MRRRPLPPVREEVPNSKSWRSVCENEWVVYTLVACVGGLSYANSLNGEFVHDDIPAIVSNRDVNGGNSVVQVFKNDFWGTPMSDPGSHKSYRPLTTLSFRLNYVLCGFSPWWWHACNVALHATCCALVARTGALVARLQRPFAALAALLFAVHPIHTEAVSGVVGRADVLACLFFLCSLLLYHGSSGRHRVWASVVLAALSMLAKETGLTVLLFNIAFDLYRCWSPISRLSSVIRCRWRGDGVWGRVARVLAALVVLVGVRLALLQGSLPAFSPQDNPPAFHSSFIVRLLTFCYLAAFNWWLLLCPCWLSHDWQMGSVPLVAAWDPRNLMTCAAILALVALSYRCLVDLELQRHTPVVVGLLLLVIPYLPASNLLVTVGFVVAERVLYIPSIGSVILTAYGMELLWRRANSRWLLFLVAATSVASGVARTHLRNRDWRTRETLLRADLAVLPHNAKLHYNFANFLKDIEQQENAIKHYKEALKLWPSYASAHNNLGTLVSGWSRAEHHFLQALKYNRDHVNAHYNLAKLYRKKNRNAESLKMLERCITLEPRFIQAYLEILHLTDGEEKRVILDKLVELEPGNWEHYLLYGNWYKERGLLPLSLRYYTTAMQLSFSGTSQNHERGKILSTRAACLAHRSNGQTARVVQLVTRWQASGGGQPQWARARAARAWRLRTELAGRAALYARPHAHHAQTTSTCLHHSKLEISSSVYVNGNQDAKSDTRTLVAKTDVPRDKDTVVASVNKNHCENKDLKKSVSISAQYKPTHNKSDIGHKQKSCPLHNKKKIKEPETFTPFVSDHLIKTY